MSEEVEFEPIPGLPSTLPAGEEILWQGRPRWQTLAVEAFSVRWLAAYFAVFASSRGVAALFDGRGIGAALFAVLLMVPLAGICLAVLSLLAFLNARATVYTMTTKRVVMRIGVAFPVTFNLPFRRLAGADLKKGADGCGDISLQLCAPDRIAWIHVWPHARPWRLAKAEPTLRAIPDAESVAHLLAAAIAKWSVKVHAPSRPVDLAQVPVQDSPLPKQALG